MLSALCCADKDEGLCSKDAGFIVKVVSRVAPPLTRMFARRRVVAAMAACSP